MTPSVDIWWTLGPAAELAARPVAGNMTAVPPDWRRGLRGRFLRDVCRRYLDGPPDWTARGASRGWRFNLSAGQHLSLTDSGPCLIVAVSRGTPVGIDAERVRPVDDAAATIGRLGSGRLAEVLGRMGPAPRNRAFAHLWTAFEAFLKLERLPWDQAADRFAAVQDQWRFSADGRATFMGQARSGLVFQAVTQIPGILLTVASPVCCGVRVEKWGAGAASKGPANATSGRAGLEHVGDWQ
jgi:hypothetical protein